MAMIKNKLLWCIVCEENSCIAKGKYRICLNKTHNRRKQENEIRYHCRPAK
jgi:hypothetical protein